MECYPLMWINCGIVIGDTSSNADKLAYIIPVSVLGFA